MLKEELKEFKSKNWTENLPDWALIPVFMLTIVLAYCGILAVLVWGAAFVSTYWILGTACVLTGLETICYDGKADMTTFSYIITFTHTIPIICYGLYRIFRK